MSLKNGSLSVHVEKTASGEWVISFVAEKRLQPTASAVKLDVLHNVIQCGNERILRIKGSIKDNIIENYPTVLETEGEIQTAVLGGQTQTAVPNSEVPSSNENKRIITLNRTNKGRNVNIEGNGRTAYRKSPLTDSRDFSGTVTSVPLEEEQLFEVRFDSIIDRQEFTRYPTAFGVIVTPPSNIESTRWIHHGMGTWAVNGQWIWIDGKPLTDAYRGYPLNTVGLPAGNRIAAMVKKNGDLHFFKDGKDMGLAARNVPKGVYGFVELNNYVSRVSVVS